MLTVWIPSNVRLYEIRTSRGLHSLSRKEVQIPSSLCVGRGGFTRIELNTHY